jgi:hypothetical protein
MEGRLIEWRPFDSKGLLLNGLPCDHQPEASLVAGARKREKIWSLFNHFESRTSKLLFNEVRANFVILDLLGTRGRSNVLVERF